MIRPIRVYLHYEEGVFVTWRSIWKVKKKERRLKKQNNCCFVGMSAKGHEKSHS